MLEQGRLLRILEVFAMLALLTVVAWFAWSSYTSALGYEQTTRELMNATDVDARWSRKLMEWLSFGLSDKNEEEMAYIAELQQMTIDLRDRAQKYYLAFVCVSLLGTGLVYAMQRRRSSLLLAMLAISFVALAAGLAAPAMAVTAAKQFPMVGTVVLYFQSKGIWSTIVELFRPGGSLFIGIPILLFSVIIPIVKTLALMAAVVMSRARRIKGLKLAHKMGKWAMADVCVVSWLLAFMATERQEFMRAELQVGILFFATYAIVSIAAGLMVERELHLGEGRGISE